MGPSPWAHSTSLGSQEPYGLTGTPWAHGNPLLGSWEPPPGLMGPPWVRRNPPPGLMGPPWAHRNPPLGSQGLLGSRALLGSQDYPPPGLWDPLGSQDPPGLMEPPWAHRARWVHGPCRAHRTVHSLLARLPASEHSNESSELDYGAGVGLGGHLCLSQNEFISHSAGKWSLPGPPPAAPTPCRHLCLGSCLFPAPRREQRDSEVLLAPYASFS